MQTTHPRENLNFPYEDVDPESKADDLVIDETNFDSYFHDVRYHDPKPGQVMARFRGRAEFVDGTLKRALVAILTGNAKGGEGSQKVMRKMAGASERDSIRVPLQIATDLASGMSVDAVCDKPYEYDCEFFFYTDPTNVPADRRWDVIRLIGRPGEKWEIASDIDDKIAELGLNNTEDGAAGFHY